MSSNKLYFNFLRKYACKKKNIGYCIIVIGLIFLNTIISLIRPRFQGKMIDDLSRPTDMDRSLFMWELALFLGMFIVYYTALYIQRYIVTAIGEEIAADVRGEIHDKLCSVKVDFFSKFELSDILLRMEKDVAAVKKCSVTSIITLASNVMIIAVIPPYMWAMHKGIAASNFALLLCVPFANRILGGKIQKTGKQILREYNDITSALTNSYHNWFVVRMFQCFQYVHDKYDKKNQAYKSEINKQNLLYSLNLLLTILLQCIGTIIIWVIGVKEVFEGSMTVGMIITLMDYQGIIMNPIIGVVDFANEYHTAIASLRDIDVFLAYPNNETEGKTEVKSIEEITLKGVAFQYSEAEEMILQNISCSFRRGIIYAIHGKSGQGKSTLFKLLAGICIPSEGEILINKNKIIDCNLTSYWKRIGYVMQRSQFFKDSVKMNLFCGNSFEEAEEIAECLDLQKDILALPDGWETEIKTEPYNFSEGQMRRIDVLRNVLKEADILIFDEATANIDKKCRNNFYKLLHKLAKDRIIFYSTHNKEELDEADVVIDLNEFGGNI